MRKLLPLFVVALVSGVAFTLLNGQDPKPKPEPKVELKTLQDQASYAIGMNIARQFKPDQFKLNPELVARGLADAYGGGTLALSTDELESVFAKLNDELQRAKLVAAEKTLEAGREFLAKNAKKKGVRTTKSGLQYEVIRAGTGPIPKASNRVYTHYKGQLINGTVFDGSYQGDAPTKEDELVDFQVNRVIRGWTEALQLMKTGAKWRLYIPSELAYGERGSRGAIGPNEVLIFDIELIRFE